MVLIHSWIFATGSVENEEIEKGLAKPFLSSSDDYKQDDNDEQECDASEEAPKEYHGAAKSMRSAYRLLTPSVKVCAYFRV